MLRRTFGPKKDEVTRACKRLYKKELYDLYSSPNIIRVIKSGRRRWAGHVAPTGRGKVHAGFWWRDLRGGDHLEDTGDEGRLILEWILKKWDGAWTGLIWLRIGTGGGLL
jgi:hypothetical protein